MASALYWYLNVPTHPHQNEDEGGFATPTEKLKNGMGRGWEGLTSTPHFGCRTKLLEKY
jgi:hypothetical protein